jgi:hypothetical protein
MAKNNVIKVADLHVEIKETLTQWHRGINSGIDFESQKAVENLEKITKATAPEGKRGSFRRNITSGVKKKMKWATTYAWYVKSPDYRLTHLLVHGHATKDGGRTEANPFLHNALDQVLPAYEIGVQSVFDYYNDIRNVDGKYHTRGMGD